MALVFSNLTNGVKETASTLAVTASISPSPNALVILSVAIRNASSTNPTISSISGNGLTWVLVDSSNYDDNSSSRRTLFVYRSMGSSPSAGAITITAGEQETDFIWSVDQVTGVDTSGTNGSGAVGVHGNNRINTTDSPASSLTVTLSSFSNSSNKGFGAFAEAGSGAGMTAGSGCTQLAYLGASDTNIAILTEYGAANDNTIDMTMGGSFAGEGGVAFEVKIASSASAIKTVNGLAYASVKTVNGLAIASVKTINGLA